MADKAQPIKLEIGTIVWICIMVASVVSVTIPDTVFCMTSDLCEYLGIPVEGLALNHNHRWMPVLLLALLSLTYGIISGIIIHACITATRAWSGNRTSEEA